MYVFGLPFLQSECVGVALDFEEFRPDNKCHKIFRLLGSASTHLGKEQQTRVSLFMQNIINISRT